MSGVGSRGEQSNTAEVSTLVNLAALSSATAGQFLYKTGESTFAHATPSEFGLGTIVLVSGTENRITSTGGTSPVLDISSTYIGQTSITTLGTIITGTWSGTAIAVNKGGTGGTSASITLFNNITGFTASGTTGTTSTNLVFSTSPVLVTPSLGIASATSLTQIGSANTRAVNNKILYGETTDSSTAVELTTDGGAGSGSTNRIAVPANTTLSIVLNIAVKQSSSANAKQMLRQVVITNNAGTTALSGSVIALGTDTGDAGLTTVTCTITANNTDDCLSVVVNGVAGTNLRYSCYVVSSEVTY